MLLFYVCTEKAMWLQFYSTVLPDYGCMFIKNDLNTVCVHRIKSDGLSVGAELQRRGTLPFSSIFTIWFVQHLTEALIITPWGHCCSYNSWKREMDLLVSICPFVCQSSVDCCINCIPAAVGSWPWRSSQNYHKVFEKAGRSFLVLCLSAHDFLQVRRRLHPSI